MKSLNNNYRHARRLFSLALIGSFFVFSAIAQASGCAGANFTQPAGSPIGVGNFPILVVSADFNLDGKPDLATTNDDSASVTILLGDGNGGFSPAAGSPVAVGLSPLGLVVGDFNKDGKPDLAVANFDNGSVSILLGNGSGGFSVSTILVGSSPNTIVVGDFNLDNKPDLAITNKVASGTVTILLGDGNGGFSPAAGSPASVGSFPYSVASGDFNLDGKPDLAVTNFSSASVTILLGNGSGGFSPAAGSPISVGSNPGWVVVSDFNLDGKPDLAVADVQSFSNLNILLGNGSGGFVQAAGSPISVAGMPIFVTASDFNLDGKPDLALTNFSNVVLLFGDGTGAFAQPIGSPVTVGSSPRSVAVADFNLDGKPDFAAANGSSNNVTIEINKCGGTPTTAVSSSVNPSDLNQSVTFTAMVTSGAGTPTGTAQFKDNGTNLGAAVALNGSGVAQLTTSALTVGAHTITSDYSGDTNFLGSSGTLSGGQVVRPQPSLSINDVSISEGDTGTKTLNFTATLSAASNLTVKANFATVNGTAAAPTDYVATNGTLTFNPGETTKTIPVTINGNTKFEPDKTFTITLSTPVNATINKATGTGTILNDDALGGFISFSQGTYTVNEADGFVTLTVNRTNDVSQVATVDYATDDTGALANCATVNGLASSRCDFTTAMGTLKFAAGETQKTITVLVNRDSYVEGPEMFTVNLSNLTGGALFLTPSTATVTINDSPVTPPLANLIDDPSFFVRQHYHDFLNREPDASGLQFWTNQITSCGSDVQCIEVKRINVSAAFFLSNEFQDTGGTAYLTNKAAFGPVPVYSRFERDSQALGQGYIFGAPGAAAVIEANKVAYYNNFVNRPEFIANLGSLSNGQYVDALIGNTGVAFTQAERDALVNGLNSSTETRATVLRKISEKASYRQAEMNRMFVLMEYFGYLRRDPDASGFTFWLNKLNQFNGDYTQAEMVKAFIISAEYRQRLGP